MSSRGIVKDKVDNFQVFYCCSLNKRVSKFPHSPYKRVLGNIKRAEFIYKSKFTFGITLRDSTPACLESKTAPKDISREPHLERQRHAVNLLKSVHRPCRINKLNLCVLPIFIGNFMTMAYILFFFCAIHSEYATDGHILRFPYQQNRL